MRLPKQIRRWLAFGAGVAVDAGREDLRVLAVRVRPSGVRVLGETSIPGWRERPAAEWGAVYAAFLRKLDASHLAATVLLPRRETTVRHIALPGVASSDLDNAVRYQLDTLHPYEENEAVAAWSRLDGASAFLVGVTRQAVIDRYVELFAAAGVKVASFTFAAAALYSALRLFGSPPAEGFLGFSETPGGLEVYGESPSRPVFSAVLGAAPERVRAMALAELRLEDSAPWVPLAGLLPPPAAQPEDFDLSRSAQVYAAALAGACPWLALAANLLPAPLRQSSSRAIYIPTIALASLLALVLGALLVHRGLENRRYLAAIQSEIARVEPGARRVAGIDRQIAAARARTQLIEDFKRRSKSDLDALNELTRLLAPPVWLNNLEMTRTGVTLAGEAEQAAPLLKILDSSPMFLNSEFAMGIMRSQSGEVFRVRAQREGVAR